MKHKVSPRPEFKRELWNTLEKSWQAHHLPMFRWYQTHWFRFSAHIVTIVGLFASFGTGAYAYSSPEVAEGTVLYPIKQQMESVEEKLNFTPQAKTKFLLKKLQRREAEKKFLESKHQKLEQTKEQIKQSEEQLQNLENELDDKNDSVLIDRVKKKLEGSRKRERNMEKDFKAETERMDKMTDEEFFSYIEKEADQATYKEDPADVLDNEQIDLENQISKTEIDDNIKDISAATDGD